jgi:Taurine catabolism dioxygenase TauD, TfdA family
MLHEGLGFFLIRGFPIGTLDAQEQVILFAGLASYIGNVRARQDQGGAAMSHVTDLTQVHANTIGNPAFTAGPQAMHTDPGHIIGMLCLNVAAEGGESVIASSSTIYNQLAQSRPDLIKTLAEDWIFDG